MNIKQLVAAGIGPTQARAFAPGLVAACAKFGINTPLRQAAFIAQTRHESGGFVHLEESLYYTTPERIRAMWPTRVLSLADAATLTRQPQKLANRVYANRNGNGDESSGDGWRFIGRALLQVTGRANYAAMTTAINDGNDYESVPELLAQPDWACMASAAWWATHGCNELADQGLIDKITRTVNGPAMAGAAERRANYTEALDALTNHALEGA
jgi:putative chitinase